MAACRLEQFGVGISALANKIPKKLYALLADQGADGLQARPPTDGDISDSVHPANAQYFTLAPHIKGVKAM